MTNFETLIHWIEARYMIKVRRSFGDPFPWTDDPILQSYRFCNVHREDDKVTQWIFKHWLEPNAKDENVWFACAVARFFNLPDTLDEIGYPVGFIPERMRLRLKQRRQRKDKIFNPAYLIIGGMNHGNGDKIDRVIDCVLKPLWEGREALKWWRHPSLQTWYERLRQFNGMGSFMAGQVVADYKHVIKNAPGHRTFAVSGPGSRRGLNRILDYPTNASWNENDWREAMTELHPRILNRVPSIPFIDMQNLQNCLCEVDKYIRIRNGEGRSKSYFVYPDGSIIKPNKS